MNNFIYAIVLLLVTVGLGVGMAFKYKSNTYEKIKDEETCDKQIDTSSGKCGVWEGGTCWEGKCKTDGCKSGPSGVECDKPPDIIFLLMLVASVITFIIFIVFLVRGIKHKGASSVGVHQSLNFGYGDDDSTCGSE